MLPADACRASWERLLELAEGTEMFGPIISCSAGIALATHMCWSCWRAALLLVEIVMQGTPQNWIWTIALVTLVHVGREKATTAGLIVVTFAFWVLTRRQREARNKAASGEGSPSSLDSEKCEKCYLCKSLVPLLQYQRHVDSCLQAARQAQGTRRLRRAKDTRKRERGLLRMLELSESKSEDADVETPLTGLGDQESPPELSAGTSGEPVADSPVSLQHLSFHVSPAKPGISSEAMDGVMDSEPRVALRVGSQQQTKGCRRRRHKF